MVAAVAMSAQLRLSPDLDAAAGTELRHECAIPPNRVQGEQVNLHVIIQLHFSPLLLSPSGALALSLLISWLLPYAFMLALMGWVPSRANLCMGLSCRSFET